MKVIYSVILKIIYPAILMPVLTVIVPISIGLASREWIAESIDSSASVLLKLLSSVSLGFSLCLIYSLIMGSFILRLAQYELNAGTIWEDIGILFISCILGIICAGISVEY
jgi:predicted Na+-dependent transporter